MPTFNLTIDGFDGEYEFDCHEFTEPINIGDAYVFWFDFIGTPTICRTESEMLEINENEIKSTAVLDFVSGFWKKCFKIKNTNFDISKLDN